MSQPKTDAKPVRQGCIVRLLSKPDGCASRDYPLTVGNTYSVLGFDGSNVITTTDEPGRTAAYWRGRVERIERKGSGV